MTHPAHAAALRLPSARLRAARRQLMDTGDVVEGALDAALRLSWQRSRDFGLSPSGRAPGAPHASAAQLQRALDHQRELVAHARPVMEYLFDQTGDTGSMVILADAQGLLLQALGDAHFLDRAERVALRPGATWHEQWRGTNAIGTALVEVAPTVVHGGEHYLERNGFLTCTAAPIIDPAGRVLGVLDISGDQRGYHRHTLALVRAAARMVEHRLFDTRHAASLRLRLHAQPEGIGTLTEGLLALTDEGLLSGANAAALAMLGLPATGPRNAGGIGACSVESMLQLDLATLCDWCRRPSTAPRTVRRHDGSVLWVRVEPGRYTVQSVQPAQPALSVPQVQTVPKAHGVPAAQSGEPTDALATLDTGDAVLHAALHRARRVLDKPIALLLQGESGVGKELFARAVHASSARRGKPFVAVNCAALPEALIEAELFGYRPGAFTGAARDGAPGRIREAHGGTLFLDEIGDMPPALQARLLRVLQEREVQPLGGGKAVAVDFRLVCATHRHLRSEMAAGRFREDLYYRLNGLLLVLPPLRERTDQPALIARLLAELQPGRLLTLAPMLRQAMARAPWPGNLRQLHNALRTACALLEDDETQIDWAHLPDDLVQDLVTEGAVAAEPLREPVHAPVLGSGSPERPDDAIDLRTQSARSVAHAVQASAGNLSEAARRLGISRNTLYRKLRAQGLRQG
jgi:transcriptional regulator of acetoin/glycerol metabolism